MKCKPQCEQANQALDLDSLVNMHINKLFFYNLLFYQNDLRKEVHTYLGISLENYDAAYYGSIGCEIFS